jgi:hypothetical protein
MRQHLSLAGVVLCLGGTSALVAQSRSPSTDTLPTAVRRTMGEAVLADAALSLGGPPQSKALDMTPSIDYAREMLDEGTLDRGLWGAKGLTVWSAFPGNFDHAHRYTVAQVGHTLFRLGGFAAPELLALDDALGTSHNVEAQRAVLLAALADPNGGERLTVADTLRSALQDGGAVVLLRTRSYQSHAFAPYWTTLRYSFVFAADGALRGWESREERK